MYKCTVSRSCVCKLLAFETNSDVRDDFDTRPLRRADAIDYGRYLLQHASELKYWLCLFMHEQTTIFLIYQSAADDTVPLNDPMSITDFKITIRCYTLF